MSYGKKSRLILYVHTYLLLFLVIGILLHINTIGRKNVFNIDPRGRSRGWHVHTEIGWPLDLYWRVDTVITNTKDYRIAKEFLLHDDKYASNTHNNLEVICVEKTAHGWFAWGFIVNMGLAIALLAITGVISERFASIWRRRMLIAAQEPVNADSPVKSAGNEENHEVQEGKDGK
jgi:hypothetical protein